MVDTPKAVDVERATLGSMMLCEPGAVDIAATTLCDADFYIPQHQIIFNAMKWMWTQSIVIDQLSLTQCLSDRGELQQIGEPAIASIAGETLSAANIRYHCDVLKEKKRLRALMSVQNEIEAMIRDTDNDSHSISQSIIQRIESIEGVSQGSTYKSMADIMPAAYAEIERRSRAREGLVGITTGFPKLNEATGGWQPKDYIILAARPSEGKTTLVLNFVINAARRGHPVGIFSMEMGATKLGERFLASEASVATSKVHYAPPTQEQWSYLSSSSGRLYNFPIIVDDTAGLNILDITARAKRMVKEKNVELIVIDYMQLVAGLDERSRQHAVENISRGLKKLAMNLNVVVIAVSQFSRFMKGDENQRPMLSSLRDSGALEADADMVIFIHDPTKSEKEKYLADYSIHATEKEMVNMREILLAKNRQGARVEMLALWQKEFYRFGELERSL